MDNIHKKENNPRRASRMSEDHKLFLIQLINEKKDIIENKTTDKISIKSKQLAWEEIEKKYKVKNQHRSSESLQMAWRNIKKMAKQYSTNMKKQSLGTGGGKKKILENEVFDAALNVINHVTVIGLHNEFDNDADLTIEEFLDDYGDSESNNAVFEYLLKNDQVPDWKKNSPSNLKSSVSEPLKIKKNKSDFIFRPYDTHKRADLSPKNELALILKKQAIEKHGYEIELLKLKIEKEELSIQKMKDMKEIDDESDYEKY
ncbi:uncharacterized protein LOC141537121 [Cotesia typhae]|uniref:uncharacterized protein LOC141537121 n=1 Tax=Cotesia typhae TaxID=2053667 RepID=UPI003D68B4E2